MFFRPLLIVPVLLLSACGGGWDDYSSDYSSSSSTQSDKDALAYATTPYTFTCSSGSSKTINVSNGPCLSSQKAYTKATACNDVANFKSTGVNFYQCAVNNSSGRYVSYYQQYLTYYKNM
jgi:hypothetical protein